MIEWIFWLLAILWMVEALAAAVNAGMFVRWTRQQDARWSGVGPDKQRPVALVVSAKGFDPDNSPRFFEAVLHQDYARYRLLLAVESIDDPVVAYLSEAHGINPGEPDRRPEGKSPGLSEVRLVVAGPCLESGQKVHNQLAALEKLAPEDEIVAFGDADILCDRDWLARLVAPINAGTHPLSTTYRWLIPRRPNLANLFACVINASVATVGRDSWSVLWGGSMAMTRRAFDDLDVTGLLKGSLNDDLRINKVARASGYRMAYVRSLMMPSPVDHTWASLWEFGCRQYYQVRIFSPILYRLALIPPWVYTLGFLGSLVAAVGYGYRAAWIPIVFVAICDQIRAGFRPVIYSALFEEKCVEALRKTAPVEHLATPLWMFYHCLLVTGALFVRKIRWAGIEYRAHGVDRTEVLGRVDET